MSKGEIPLEEQQSVIEIPSHIVAQSRFRSGKGKEMATLIETLKLLGATKCCCFDSKEFARRFSAQQTTAMAKNNLYHAAKKLNEKIRIVEDKDKIYCWRKEA